MSLKDTKILIAEVPGEWTQRTRNGSTNVWNDASHHRFHRTTTDLPELRLDPPEKGLYAERIDGAWYWVCGCEKCLGNFEKHSYIVCDDHNRCDTCAKHRSEFHEAVWGTRGGWRCNACRDHIHEERKAAALAAAKESGHNEYDCQNEDEIICPYCATKQSSDDANESAIDSECGTCGGIFDVEVEFTRSFSTTGKQPPTT